MAALSVREALSLSSLASSTVLAGHDGLDRSILSVNMMEVPDVEAFVRPGDLLLTTAYPIHSDPAQLTRLVRYFSDRTIAALAIKVGRYLDAIPDECIALCDELGFPLIRLDDQLSFNTVIQQVMSIVLADYGVERERLDLISQRLTTIALSGGGLHEIAAIVARTVHAQILVTDASGAEITRAGEPAAGESQETRFEFSIDGQSHGALIVAHSAPLSLGQRLLINRARFASEMHIAQRRAEDKINDRLRTLALKEAVNGITENRAHNAVMFGWTSDGWNLIIAADQQIERDDRLTCSVWGPSAVMWTPPGMTLVVTDATSLPGTVRSCLDEWGTHFPSSATLASGWIGTEPGDLPGCYRSALATLAHAQTRRLGRATYDECEMDFLLDTMPREDTQRFVRRQLGPLLDYDATHSTNLVETLDHVLTTPNRRVAAESLFIHYNTLKYRMEVINELIGPWEEPEQRRRLALACSLATRQS